MYTVAFIGPFLNLFFNKFISLLFRTRIVEGMVW